MVVVGCSGLAGSKLRDAVPLLLAAGAAFGGVRVLGGVGGKSGFSIWP